MAKYESKIIIGQFGIPSYEVLQLREKKSNFALVIPIINEGKKILLQLQNIKSTMPGVDVFLADGGSTDESLNLDKIQDLNLTGILTIRSPGRLSAQLRMAFHYCLENGYQGVITMDGNNKDDPAGIKSIKQALENDFDFIQGSRFKRGGAAINTPIDRYISIRFLHAPLTSLFSRFWFTDTTNGFRGFSRTLLDSPKMLLFRDIFIDYALLAYIPIAAGRNGFKICEVPVIRQYPKNTAVPTKIHGTRAKLTILQILIMAGLGRFDPE